MRTVFLISFIIITNTKILQAQSSVPNKVISTGAHISFISTIHDFGIIPYLSDGSYVYVFKNTGTEQLTITNVIKGCGCTSVDWTKDPIKPGQKGIVKATYNTAKVGPFNRGVDVYSNDINNPKINLRLKGTVEKVSSDSTANK